MRHKSERMEPGTNTSSVFITVTKSISALLSDRQGDFVAKSALRQDPGHRTCRDRCKKAPRSTRPERDYLFASLPPSIFSANPPLFAGGPRIMN